MNDGLLFIKCNCWEDINNINLPYFTLQTSHFRLTTCRGGENVAYSCIIKYSSIQA